jgi:hypothetical protein
VVREIAIMMIVIFSKGKPFDPKLSRSLKPIQIALVPLEGIRRVAIQDRCGQEGNLASQFGFFHPLLLRVTDGPLFHQRPKA